MNSVIECSVGKKMKPTVGTKFAKTEFAMKTLCTVKFANTEFAKKTVPYRAVTAIMEEINASLHTRTNFSVI